MVRRIWLTPDLTKQSFPKGHFFPYESCFCKSWEPLHVNSAQGTGKQMGGTVPEPYIQTCKCKEKHPKKSHKLMVITTWIYMLKF